MCCLYVRCKDGESINRLCGKCNSNSAEDELHFPVTVVHILYTEVDTYQHMVYLQ